MSTAETVALGAVAGFTIFLGLPVARLTGMPKNMKILLNGVSAGVLLFLLHEVLEHAGGPVEDAVEGARWGAVAGYGALYAGGIAAGVFSLVHLAGRWRGKASIGPGAAALVELDPGVRARSLAMQIATGIGLHNFSEGLAIGAAATAGETSLAVLLVVGFALHNATEGFGIAGPLAAADVRPSWRWIGVAGLVGGGPTFVGTLIGTVVTSELVFTLFLALAAGAIIYVIGEIWSGGRKLSQVLTLWGIFAGLVLSFATELVLKAAGV
jgi:ZIP family zinc transporter